MSKRRSGVEDRWTRRDPSTGKRVPTTEQGKGRRWVARYDEPGGREVKRRFATRVEAERWLDGITAGAVRGDYVPERGGKITVSDWSTAWLASKSNLKPSTRRRYDGLLAVQVLPTFGSVSLSEVTHAGVAEWVAEMVRPVDDGGKGLAASTARQAHRVLSLLLGYAVADGRLARNVAEGVPLPRAAKPSKRFLSMTEVRALAEAAGERDRLLMLVLALTGLRFGEAAALRVERVDLTRNRLNIEEAATEVDGRLVYGLPKTHQARSVPFPAFLADDLRAACEDRDPEAFVFTAPKGGPLRLMNFRRNVFDPAVRAAGLGDVTPHDLRHTAASLAIASGANVKAVQRMLGHASAAMTLDVYSGLFDDDLSGVADRLGTAFGASA